MKTTDWDAYYSRPYKTATITRKITGNRLIKILNDIQDLEKKQLNLIELGGANSCFFDSIQEKVRPLTYSILDNNSLGLQKFKDRIGNHHGEMINADVLNLEIDKNYDIVFSVGLIEHFDQKRTKQCVISHWNLVKTGGHLVLFFPTPTLLYRITRKIAELTGLWIFHDERALNPDEVVSGLPNNAKLIKKSIIWPIFLTQSILVFKKN